MGDKTFNFLTTETLNQSWQVIRSSYLQRTAETHSFSCAISHVASCWNFISFLYFYEIGGLNWTLCRFFFQQEYFPLKTILWEVWSSLFLQGVLWLRPFLFDVLKYQTVLGRPASWQGSRRVGLQLFGAKRELQLEQYQFWEGVG